MEFTEITIVFCVAITSWSQLSWTAYASCSTAIYSFGDSLADTGNYLTSIISNGSKPDFDNLPYGETYFGKPTGRLSDGRLIVDYIANASGLPLLDPYLSNTTSTFECGVNFAVVGATALDPDFFTSKNIESLGTTFSLDTQIQWFLLQRRKFCATYPGTACNKHFANALFLMGEIGGNAEVETRLGLPSGPEYDRNLLVIDRSFTADGAIYLNSTGDNPSIHPQWQPESFGHAIIVNGKVWPYMKVKRRKYRFRIVNANNARFCSFALSNGLSMTFVGSDSAYLPAPVSVKQFLLAPSEIADIVVDFNDSATEEATLTNDAPYPYPSGSPVDELNSKVMKFIIETTTMAAASSGENRPSARIPEKLIEYRRPSEKNVAQTRYVIFYEYESASGQPTQLLINGLPFDAPVTETPREGTSEIWNVINLTVDNHPLHIHLALFLALGQTELVKLQEFKSCMQKYNDALKCDIQKHATGKVVPAPAQERGWKNVFKMNPGYMTTILVQFSLLNLQHRYPFNASAEPGYLYHCHIVDHEDNEMMRPFKIRP